MGMSPMFKHDMHVHVMRPLVQMGAECDSTAISTNIRMNPNGSTRLAAARLIPGDDLPPAAA